MSANATRAFCLSVFLCAAPLYAQTLDVGGVAIRLGEPFDEMARRVTVVYELMHVEGVSFETGGQIWTIRPKSREGAFLGGFDVKDGRVVAVRRDWQGDEYSISRGFVEYLNEARRLGGSACVTTPGFTRTEGENAPSRLFSYTTQCGRYRIVHTVVLSKTIDRETLSIEVW